MRREGAPLPVVQPSEAGIHGRSGGEGAAVATNERAAAEMFAGIVREVVEETGVPIACLVREMRRLTTLGCSTLVQIF